MAKINVGIIGLGRIGRLHMMNFFFECITKDLDPPVSPIDGLETMEVINEAYRYFNEKINQSFHVEDVKVVAAADSSKRALKKAESLGVKNLYRDYHHLINDDLVREGTANFFLKIVGKKIHPLSYTYYYESYYKEMKLFFECITKDLDPPVSPIDGLKTMEVINEAYRYFNEKINQSVN